MKIIFLDLDSVIVLYTEWNLSRSGPFDTYPFNKNCVQVLNEILEAELDLQIILTSDWRSKITLWEMDQIFKHNGVKRSPVGYTPVFETKFWPQGDELAWTRSEEIKAWLNEFDQREQMPYVVVDDLVMSEWFPDRFVDCSLPDVDGISTPGYKEKVLQILGLLSEF